MLILVCGRSAYDYGRGAKWGADREAKLGGVQCGLTAVSTLHALRSAYSYRMRPSISCSAFALRVRMTGMGGSLR